ncbi:GNAT family N-acetyltransferase [Nocardioides sp.]|uniref:GNAT family N-acetyltransferase n=1 Tax=Nocardioides sp. TaxID=35761 RepID=UPI00271F6618|nr:GNAT family N-acetyltransferase [Nocardioides sp.]MDO9456605.1 hypothetical protein [Nocardioides sp.]
MSGPVELTEGEPAEVPALVDLICARVPKAPRAEVAWMWSSPAECPDLVTLVARDANGTPLGVGRLTTPVLLPRSWAVINATVARAAEGTGVGAALYAGLLARVRDDVDQLRVTVDADDERSVAIAGHWGFEVVQVSIESELDLVATPLPAPAPGDGVVLEDATTFTFADHDAVAAMLLASQTNPEAVAGMVADLDDLRRGGGDAPVAVLARVDGSPAGITVGRVEDARLFIDYTGVDPAFRGHGLALLLKQQAHLDAVALGATSSRTNNAEHNTGIRRVNADLGYQVGRSLARLRRML